MIQDYQERLDDLVIKQRETAQKYLHARQEYARLKFEIDLELAKVITLYREKKKNLGIEMALIMKLEESLDDEEFQALYKNFLHYTARYKGLEKSLDALSQEAIIIQSLMKWNRDGELYS